MFLSTSSPEQEMTNSDNVHCMGLMFELFCFGLVLPLVLLFSTKNKDSWVMLKVLKKASQIYLANFIILSKRSDPCTQLN